MPWIRARLRGQNVYARATADGALATDGGRVEIRYSPAEWKALCRACRKPRGRRPSHFFPDDTCGPAEAPPTSKDKPGAGRNAPSSASTRTRASGPTKDPDGTVIAYADGACSGNPGPAGLGVVILNGTERIELSEYLGVQTNNIAELTAVLRTLREVPPASPLVIHTDSQYTIGVLQKGWKAKANATLIADPRGAGQSRQHAACVHFPGTPAWFSTRGPTRWRGRPSPSVARADRSTRPP